MTTVYNLTDMIIRARKRPSHTSTYASITRLVFGDSPVKELPIPVGINAYNHHMGEVDIGNQYRAGFTTLQHQSEEHTSELQSHSDLVCRLLLEKKKKQQTQIITTTQ